MSCDEISSHSPIQSSFAELSSHCNDDDEDDDPKDVESELETDMKNCTLVDSKSINSSDWLPSSVIIDRYGTRQCILPSPDNKASLLSKAISSYIKSQADCSLLTPELPSSSRSSSSNSSDSYEPPMSRTSRLRHTSPSPLRSNKAVKSSPVTINTTVVDDRPLDGNVRSSASLQCSAVQSSISDSSCQAKTQPDNSSTSVAIVAESSASSTVDGIASCCDPDGIMLECRLIPFLRDLDAIQLRLPLASLNKNQRRLLKQLCNENELITIPAPREIDQPPGLLIRKRASLITRQVEERQALRERKKQEAAAVAEKLAEELARRQLASIAFGQQARSDDINGQSGHVTVQTSTQYQEPMSKKKLRQHRRNVRRQAKQTKQRELEQKRRTFADACIQTVPEDYWLCPWCLQHIAPEALCGHEAVCSAGYRQRRREEAILANKLAHSKHGKAKSGQVNKAGGDLQQRLRSRSRGGTGRKTHRSRSRNRNATADLSSAASQLAAVHPNDLSAMNHLMQRICAEPKCRQLVDTDRSGVRNSKVKVKCIQCKQAYCAKHRPVGLHSACPAPPPLPSPSPTSNLVVSSSASVGVGPSMEERRAELKTALRQRKAQFLEARQRC